MSMDITAFETVVPSRYVTFTFPNPLPRPLPHLLHTSLLRIAVLDSPSTAAASTGEAEVAAMLVPPNRQHDWIFSTQTGHLQLLLTLPQLSRLILISNHDAAPGGLFPSAFESPSVTDCENETEQIQVSLMPLLFALTPKSAFVQNNRFPEIPFLNYEDEVISNVILEIFDGPCVGEMLVENVELNFGATDVNSREFRRRLRFKRMPNLVQTQVRIHPVALAVGDELDGVEFRVDNGVLVQPYLSPMVAGLSLISTYLDKRTHMGFRPRALCLGIGGGALVEFLSSELQFEVVGVEEDEVVLSTAKKYFGLNESEFIHLCTGDGIELIKKLAFEDKYCNDELLNCFKFRNSGGLDHIRGKYDVIMVDLDSSVATLSSAPPLEFVKKSVLLAAKRVLFEHGAVVLNVVPASKSFYDMVISEFAEVFGGVYEIDVGNGENMVLVASVSVIRPACSDHDNSFLLKLNSSIQGSYLSSLRKVSGTSLAKNVVDTELP